MCIIFKCTVHMLFEEGVLQSILADSGTDKSSCVPKSVSQTLCSIKNLNDLSSFDFSL